MYDTSAVARSRMAERMHEAEAYRLAKEARETRPRRSARPGPRVTMAWLSALTRFVRGAGRVATGHRSAGQVAFPA
jgi:hypothetical protein